MPRLVFEIRTEEIPARFLPAAESQLRQQAEQRLRAARLSFGTLRSHGSPRRLVLIGEDVSAAQEPIVREERGPAAQAAFDAAGEATQAAKGFARRQKVRLQDLVVKQTERGEYVFAVFSDPGKPAAAVLAGVLPELVAALTFPKSMRWGEGSLRFARPIRGLLALLEEEVVEFSLPLEPGKRSQLASGRTTRGHPVLADRELSIGAAAEYESELEKGQVLVDPARRREVIRTQVGQLGQQAGGRCVDGGLLEEVTYLVEWPTAFLGSFDESFLELPRAVLIEELQRVQSYFPLENESGLLPRFIGVRDGGEAHLDIVRQGNEEVLRAKLLDASYFFQEDAKRRLEDRLRELEGVIFQESLGTLSDKTERVRALARELGKSLVLSSDELLLADRAAQLCKADLVTQMVTELPALQGVMGREYALRDGEAAEVAEAIGEHYRPRGPSDPLPKSRLGRLLALADKLDTVASCFAAGLAPTGSEDPFALRREAQGIIALLVEADSRLSLEALLEAALRALYDQRQITHFESGGIPGVQDWALKVQEQVASFLRARLETLLETEAPAGWGVRYDLVDSALAVGWEDAADAARRARALQELADREPEFLPTVIASTRLSNIVRSFPGGEPDPALFGPAAERALWEGCCAARPEVEELAGRGDYQALFRRLSRLRATIDRFFDEVLVMEEEERLRTNRLSLVWQANNLFRKLGDLSLVVQEGQGQQ